MIKRRRNRKGLMILLLKKMVMMKMGKGAVQVNKNMMNCRNFLA